MRLKLGLLLTFGMTLTACQDKNSFSGDAQYAPVSASDPATCTGRLNIVKTIFLGNCSESTCHPTFATNTYSHWIASGLVTAGSPNSSSIYSRLSGSGVGTLQNMPLNRSALSNQELEDIQAWITQMSPCL